MNIITADFESFFTKDFGFSCMTTEEYIRSPLWETIGVSTKVNDGPIVWVSGDYNCIKAHLDSLPWHNHLLLAANTAFDGAILNWLYGIKPVGYLDTQSMANALHGVSESSALANLAKLYREVDKGDDTKWAIGKRRLDFTPQELEAYGEYCKHDTELTYNIFHKMLPAFPKAELRVIDLTIRMFCQPQLELDEALLTEDLVNIKRVKRESLEKLVDLLKPTPQTLDILIRDGEKGVQEWVKTQVMSNPKFAELLKAQGVEPPTKVSARTGKTAWAFAKTDEALTDLLDHENPIVSTLVSTRLENKSTIGETRTESFIEIAKRGTYPFSLRYSGAKITHRWSGFDLNPQNLPRGSTLRKAILAPAGHTLVVADSSNIELRVGMLLAGQDDAVQQIKDGVDLYKTFASEAFNLNYDDIAKNSEERFIAKVCCIAEDELVLTAEGLIPIQDITLDNVIWDGVEWVNHTGVVFMGQREVITYDGLTATEDHKVWTESGRYISFGEAASRLERLARTGDGRQAIRFMDNSGQSYSAEESAYIRKREMPVWNGEISHVVSSQGRGEYKMPEMRSKRKSPEARPHGNNVKTATIASRESKIDVPKMQMYKKQALQKLWGARNKVHVWLGKGMCGIYNIITRLGGEHVFGGGSNKQRWELRSREFEILHPETASSESKDYTLLDIQGAASTSSCGIPLDTHDQSRYNIFYPYPKQYDEKELECGEDNRAILPNLRQTKKVYDITNAGPRHRFTVSGRLVSNCLSLIYGTGAAKLKDTIRTQSKGRIVVDLAEAERLKALYRRVNSKIVDAWEIGGDIIEWVYHNQQHTAYGFLPVHGKKGIMKPSGLYLPYPGLRQEPKEDGWGHDWYYNTKRGNNTVKDKIYPAKVFQRVTQSLARDILTTQTMEINKHYWVAGMVHDEIICVVPDEEVDGAKRAIRDIMKTSPAWTAEGILDCEVGAGKRYGDAK